MTSQIDVGLLSAKQIVSTRWGQVAEFTRNMLEIVSPKLMAGGWRNASHSKKNISLIGLHIFAMEIYLRWSNVGHLVHWCIIGLLLTQKRVTWLKCAHVIQNVIQRIIKNYSNVHMCSKTFAKTVLNIKKVLDLGPWYWKIPIFMY